jgi:hypothetical protein
VIPVPTEVFAEIDMTPKCIMDMQKPKKGLLKNKERICPVDYQATVKTVWHWCQDK